MVLSLNVWEEDYSLTAFGHQTSGSYHGSLTVLGCCLIVFGHMQEEEIGREVCEGLQAHHLTCPELAQVRYAT